MNAYSERFFRPSKTIFKELFEHSRYESELRRRDTSRGNLRAARCADGL
jgi:hypothetical protein